MTAWFVAWSGAAIAFLIADGLWLGVIMKGYYMKHLAPIKRDSFKTIPAVLFYFAYTIGIVLLAIEPSGEPVGIGSAALAGAIVGFVAYGTYNMTNHCTLANWPAAVSWVDWPWGTVATTVASACGAAAHNFWITTN